ncbi:MAG TPA: hypothetical protein VFR05_07650 [Terriglobia bacterium]|nr:hypothetical protein [Terriglobia bacterium]
MTRTIVVSGSSFTAELPAGEYTVSIANLPEGYAVRSIIYGASDLLREPLRVAPTATAPQNMPRITVNLAVR